jgi:hypothetical protein
MEEDCKGRVCKFCMECTGRKTERGEKKSKGGGHVGGIKDGCVDQQVNCGR